MKGFDLKELVQPSAGNAPCMDTTLHQICHLVHIGECMLLWQVIKDNGTQIVLHINIQVSKASNDVFGQLFVLICEH